MINIIKAIFLYFKINNKLFLFRLNEMSFLDLVDINNNLLIKLLYNKKIIYHIIKELIKI